MKVLCVGSGGLRDAADLFESSFAKRHHVTVVDEDPWRLTACHEEYGSAGIRYVEGMLDEPGFQLDGEYDFIFNLNGLAARANRDAHNWLRRSIQLLAPGGRLLATSFTPAWSSLCAELGCSGIRPAFLRTEAQLAELVADLRSDAFRGHAIWTDESACLAYLEIAK